MKELLVYTEAAEEDNLAAVKKAVDIARVTSAKVHVVVNCYQGLDFFSDGSSDSAEKSQLIADQHTWWQEHLESYNSETPMTFEVIWEKYPNGWIADHCKTQHYDMLVKQVHKDEVSGYSAKDWELFRDSIVPVYAVTDKGINNPKTILVSLDMLAKSYEKMKLNEKLLETGFRLAMATNQELHCCYVANVSPLIKSLDPVAAENKRKKIMDAAMERCRKMLDTYDLKPEQIHFEVGAPYKRIASIANKNKASCVVIGSMGRKGIEGKLFGNTSEKVIQMARNDLLVINPDE